MHRSVCIYSKRFKLVSMLPTVTLADAAVNNGLSMRDSGASVFLLGEQTNKITILANVMCMRLRCRREQLPAEDAFLQQYVDTVDFPPSRYVAHCNGSCDGFQ
jgi:hypothetical protein